MALLERLPDIDSELARPVSDSPEKRRKTHNPTTERRVGHLAIVDDVEVHPASSITPMDIFGSVDGAGLEAEMRADRDALEAEEQRVMDSFHVDLEGLSKLPAAVAVFRLGKDVLDGFQGRRVVAGSQQEVDFIDESDEGLAIPAVRIIETDLNDGATEVTIVDDMLQYDHFRAVKVTATDTDPDSVRVAVVEAGKPDQIITDPDEQKYYVDKALGHVSDIVEVADAHHSGLARELATKDLVSSERAAYWSTDERRQGIIRSGVTAQPPRRV